VQGVPKSDIYSAGFYLQYLWDQRHRLTALAGFDLNEILQTLSSFHLQETRPPLVSPQTQLTDSERRIIAVYRDLLVRGLPTLPSLFVEQKLLRRAKQAGWATETQKNGVAHFVMPNGIDGWIETLVRAHVAVDPRLSTSDINSDIFDSQEESRFFHKILPKAIGKGAVQFCEPQKPFSELLPPAVAQDFVQNRVDFAISAPGIRLVVEVDGPQHALPAIKAADNKRDKALRANNWRVTRIWTKDLDKPLALNKLKQQVPEDNKFVNYANRNHTTPLWENTTGQIALQAVLAPFGVARIQRALLLALEQSVLSLGQNQWRLVFVEQDVRCALLAVMDFRQHLHHFYRLHKMDGEPPEIVMRVYTTPEFAEKGMSAPAVKAKVKKQGIHLESVTLQNGVTTASFSPGFNADLLIDISVLQHYGYNQFSTTPMQVDLSATGAAYEIRSVYSPQDRRQITPIEPFAYPIDDQSQSALEFFLQNVFHKGEFRPGQFEIIKRTLALKPVIGLLPTGAGKSLTYQMSALLQPGMTIVIDPLISLMLDQVENLQQTLAIDWVVMVNSLLTAEERQAANQAMADGKTKIMVFSPERLQSREFRNALTKFTRSYPVSYAVIDEAHCVSEWGHDFRTSYLRLAGTIRRYCNFRGYTPTIIALTGTASYAVLSDIQREIGVEDEDAQVYPDTFDREELTYRVVKTSSFSKMNELQNLLQNTLPQDLGVQWPDGLFALSGEKTRAGIVFTPHSGGQLGAQDVAGSLQMSFGKPVEYFVGKMPPLQKAKVQRGFKDNEFALLVATKAFGMGIDKPNVRYTIHYNIPPSLEAFYQEAGRAGRDREDAWCWLIFSDDYTALADAALDPNATPADVEKAASAQCDIGRLLWLHRNSFQGISIESSEIKNVYKLIDPILAENPMGTLVEMQIPFGPNQQRRDKALYRLSILGIVQDYTLDYNSKSFEVVAMSLTNKQLQDKLQNYIQRYKIQPNKIPKMPGKAMLDKCIELFLEFVYDEIEKKRRAALRSMVEVARQAAAIANPGLQDGFIRQELIAYLEKSPFTDMLLNLAKAQKLNVDAWIDVLRIVDVNGTPLLSTVDGARQLVGGCRRLLESYLEHPGLLFLSSIGRLLLPDVDEESVYSEVRRTFHALDHLAPRQRDSMMLRMLHDGYEKTILSNSMYQYQHIASIALEENPTRPLARDLMLVIPERCERVLVNTILSDVRSFNRRLSTEREKNRHVQ
jgi:ATP-dependent DNA helicase RecQ